MDLLVQVSFLFFFFFLNSGTLEEIGKKVSNI